MAKLISYTDSNIVKDRLGEFDSNITDTQIDEYIQQVEGFVESVMRNRKFISGATLAFDESKHGLIRQTVTDLTAYYLIMYSPSTFNLREKVSLMVDMLWATGMRGLAQLADPNVVEYLETL